MAPFSAHYTWPAFIGGGPRPQIHSFLTFTWSFGQKTKHWSCEGTTCLQKGNIFVAQVSLLLSFFNHIVTVFQLQKKQFTIILCHFVSIVTNDVPHFYVLPTIFLVIRICRYLAVLLGVYWCKLFQWQYIGNFHEREHFSVFQTHYLNCYVTSLLGKEWQIYTR